MSNESQHFKGNLCTDHSLQREQATPQYGSLTHGVVWFRANHPEHHCPHPQVVLMVSTLQGYWEEKIQL